MATLQKVNSMQKIISRCSEKYYILIHSDNVKIWNGCYATHLFPFSCSSLSTALWAAVRYVLMISNASRSLSVAALDSSRTSALSVRQPHSCFNLTGFSMCGGNELNSRAKNHCSTAGCLNTDLSIARMIWRKGWRMIMTVPNPCQCLSQCYCVKLVGITLKPKFKLLRELTSEWFSFISNIRDFNK